MPHPVTRFTVRPSCTVDRRRNDTIRNRTAHGLNHGTGAILIEKHSLANRNFLNANDFSAIERARRQHIEVRGGRQDNLTKYAMLSDETWRVSTRTRLI